jgi:hypothetical protein
MCTRNFTSFIRFLETNKLTFRMLAPEPDRSAWESLNDTLLAHLQRHKLEFLPHDTTAGVNYEDLPWQLLTHSASRRNDKLVFKALEVPCYEFVGDLLRKTAMRHPYRFNTRLLAISKFSISNIRHLHS